MVDRMVVTREGWGARPPKRPFSSRWRKTQGIVVHHSGVKDGPHGVAALRQFERFHMDTRGWNAIAYNWLVDEEGVVYHGRGPGVVGGATKGWNSRTESVCYTGWGSDPVPVAAQESLRWVVGYLQGLYGSDLWVKRHRDFASTGCPGDWLADWVADGMPSSSSVDLSAVLVYLGALRRQVVARYLSRWRRSRGDAVKVVQERLKAHGCDPGPIDGLFGRRTHGAVQAFQRKAGLKVNGRVDKDVWDSLMKGNV